MAPRSAIGLDIGTSGVRAAQLSFPARGAVTLERFGQVALPEGAVRDGEVVDQAAVATAIRQLWAASKFRTRRVVVGVANAKVVVRQVDLPWMPLSELKAGLAYLVQDFVPMPVEHALLDFHPLEELQTADGRMWRGLLVAAARDMVAGNLAAVHAAGLRPLMVDLTSFAVLRSLVATEGLGMQTSAEALVDVGARVTNIVVHQGGVPRFVRILMLGGQDVTEAVADRIGVAQERAEAIKQYVGHDLDTTDMQVRVAALTVEEAMAQFADEVRGSLDYYLASSTAVRVDRLVVTGGGARLLGLAERLESATRLPVERGEPIARLSVGRTGLSPEQVAYVEPLAAVPVGLALGLAS